MKTMKTAEEKRAHRNRLQREKRANRTPEQREKDNAYKRAWSAKRKQREDEALRKFQADNNIDEVREIMARREKKKAAKKLEKKRAYRRAYYQANKEKAKAQTKKWKAEHPDYMARWREENPEMVKENNRRFREENPDYHKKWEEANAEKRKTQKKNNLENLDLADETISEETRRLAWGVQVRKRDENRCYYESSECSSLIDAHHIIPYDWKTFDKLRFSLDNGMCLCRKHHIAVHKEMKLWMRE